VRVAHYGVEVAWVVEASSVGTAPSILNHGRPIARISIDVHDALNLVTTSPASENLSLVAEIVIRVRASC
jgi:hypothetical protein